VKRKPKRRTVSLALAVAVKKLSRRVDKLESKERTIRGFGSVEAIGDERQAPELDEIDDFINRHK
jgi:hypothetical protein